MSDIIEISDRISYIEATEDPLSADIGIVRDGERVWLYDVGDGEKSIEGLDGCFNVVLSHFHLDHTGNIGRISASDIFASAETRRHIGCGTVVTDDLYFGDLHIFPLPSSHAKGSLGLEVCGAFAFVGDALYSRVKDGFYIYNAQLLRDEIRVLKRLRADRLLVSHFKGLIREKRDVIAELEEIYGMRNGGDPEIKVGIGQN